MKITGGCYCGAIRYLIDGEAQASLQCYCRECCYLSGGNSVPLMRFNRDDFTVSLGEMNSFQRTDIEAAVTRYFCGNCGTGVATETPKRPGAIIVKVGTFDDPALYKQGAAIFTCDKQDYHHIPEGVPVFDRRPN